VLIEEIGMMSKTHIITFQARLSALKEEEKRGKMTHDALEAARSRIRFSIIDDFLNGE